MCFSWCKTVTVLLDIMIMSSKLKSALSTRIWFARLKGPYINFFFSFYELKTLIPPSKLYSTEKSISDCSYCILTARAVQKLKHWLQPLFSWNISSRFLRHKSIELSTFVEWSEFQPVPKEFHTVYGQLYTKRLPRGGTTCFFSHSFLHEIIVLFLVHYIIILCWIY